MLPHEQRLGYERGLQTEAKHDSTLCAILQLLYLPLCIHFGFLEEHLDYLSPFAGSLIRSCSACVMSDAVMFDFSGVNKKKRKNNGKNTMDLRHWSHTHSSIGRAGQCPLHFLSSHPARPHDVLRPRPRCSIGLSTAFACRCSCVGKRYMSVFVNTEKVPSGRRASPTWLGLGLGLFMPRVLQEHTSDGGLSKTA